MGNLRACLLVVLVACGNDHAATDAAAPDSAPDAKVFMDAPAPSFDFSCSGNSAPTMAAAQITVSGTVRQVEFAGGVMINPVDAANVEACKSNVACTGPNRLGMDSSDAMGNFTIGPFNTQSMPVNAYLHMTKTNVRANFVYPPSPMIADQPGIPMLTFQSLILANIPGCSQNDATNGLIAVAVTDCANMPITDAANLSIVIKQGGNPVTTVSVVDLSLLNQMAAGTFLVCNVPENATTNVGATYKGMALRAHDVQVVKATSTTTLLRPGY